MPGTDGYWRWNTNITWHYVTSVQYAAHASKAATDAVGRYHHLRTCLYFGIGALEAFANERMRKHLEEQGNTEEAVLKELRHGRIDTKIKAWPELMSGQSVDIDPTVLAIIDANKLMRDEITHPKRHDSSIYRDLDSFDPEQLVEAVSSYIVSVLQSLGQPFPYWLLGWNYVGLNGDPTALFQGNNGNGFAHSYSALGLRNFNPYLYGFEQQNMMTLPHYKRLKSELDACTLDIEPFFDRFPTKPRLTRRWWDAEFIRSQIPKRSEH